MLQGQSPGVSLTYPPEARLRSSFRVAVNAAVDAYGITGKTRDAALAYAAHGFPIFPLATRTKAPIPKADKDASGRKIPKTGGFYKATCDQKQIRKWWDRGEFLIGLPMGPSSGVWALDIDTAEDHADGVKAWQLITAEQTKIHTRTHLSATGGLHLILNWSQNEPVGCGRGLLPDGVDSKGLGGYICVPPSRRKGRAYTVQNDVDPIDPPDWLIDMIRSSPPLLAGISNKPPAIISGVSGQAATEYRPTCALPIGNIPVDIVELASAVASIPNNNLPWELWTKMGLAIFAATRGRGFAFFDQFSSKSSKYSAAKTLERWEGIAGSPPDRIGDQYIYKLARAHGWFPRTDPTYPAATFNDLSAARDTVRKAAQEFLAWDERQKNVFELYAESLGIESAPMAWAMRIDTGVGKTRIVVEEIAKSGKKGVVYAVPTHKLGSEVERQFAELGVTARVFRGRAAEDPENAGKKMCLNLDAVDLALEIHADVSQTCCEYKGKYCQSYDRCGYQRQRATGPQVWIVAADTLFHHQSTFRRTAALIVDESFWQKALRGIEPGERCIVPLGGLAAGDQGRRDLAAELSMQINDGGLERRYIEDMDYGSLGQMIKVEWAKMPKTKLRPGMSEADVRRMKQDTRLIGRIALARRLIRILEELRHMLRHPDIAVSGRLILEENDGQRVVRWRGIAPISKQFQKPTLLLDATLPDLSVLRILHPEAEIVADVQVELPATVHITQFLNAPSSSRKLIETTRLKDRDQHLNAVKRHIIQRWIETDRKPALVICQMKVETWLRDRLPAGITVAHFNAIAGLDNFRDVRLLILIGRVQPGPEAVEVLAATLSGSEPAKTPTTPQSFAWYDRICRGIRLRDGKGAAVDGDQHHDPFVEAVRKLITEAELVQALGRGRAVNRTEQMPLDIDLLFNTVLPVTVDAVSNWVDPSLLIETAAEGVMLLSSVDMVRIWPTIWPNTRAADRTLAMGVPALPGFERISYQVQGPKMKSRSAYFDPTIIPDPRSWLQSRLGPLTDLS